MEGTAPQDIVNAGGVAAYPTKSLFQTDLIALKLRLPASWGLRNPAQVAMVSGTNW
jgi:hypothetical protein